MSAVRMGRKWADVDEDDDEVSTKADGVASGFETKPDENGIKTVIEYRERDGKTYKLTKKVKETVLTSWTNKNIQARKDMPKFGKPAQSDPSTEKHLVVRSEEEIPVELSKKSSAQVAVKDEAEDKFYEESLTIAETMNQQKKAWTDINKMKQEARDEVGDQPILADKLQDLRIAADLVAAAQGGRSAYVPPSLRGKGAEDAKGKGKGGNPEEASLRVTNVSEDCKEGDLQDLFSSVGRVSRVYLAKDQLTGASRGFAFVTYYTRADAEKAIKKLHGHGYDNLILQVSFAKPRA
mmetsp:Transcript_132050/g.422535  ORF Transcript_132050/g.422535 Transcript_132050/m.422535 type:complete len:294 (-) Transcript_132050:266-1147(-)